MAGSRMDVFEAIEARRSVKRWKGRPVPAETIRRLLRAAVLAPNHGMTEPWGFFVLGDQTKRVYAETRARLKAAPVVDEEAAAMVRDKVVRSTLEIPTVIAVTQHLDDDEVVREEDYAATFMAIENLALAAVGLGLATKIHTGDILYEAGLRSTLDVGADERIVAFVDLGEPEEVPAAKVRTPAEEKTRWLP